MYVVGSAVLAVLLVFLEKTKVLKLHKTSSAIVAMVMTAAVAGLYFAEGARLLAAMGVKVTGLKGKEYEYVKIFGSTSKAAIVAKTILMIVCAVPSAAGLIYMAQALVRKAVIREGYEADNVYSARRAKASAARGLAAAVGMIGAFALMVILALPHLDELMQTMMIVLNPFILLIFCLLTFGIALIPLTGYFLVVNGVLFMVVSGLGAAALVLYILSVIFGISAAGSAVKSGAISKGRGTIYGLLSLLAGWNIVVFCSLKKEISKNAG